MARAKVTLFVVPSEVDMHDLADYDVSIVGNVMSNQRELKVNRVDDGSYTIILGSAIFKALNPKSLIQNIIRIFQANLPNTVIDISAEYLYDLDDDEYDAFDTETAEAVMTFDIKFHDEMKMASPSLLRWVRYRRSESVINTAETYTSVLEGDDGEDEGDDSDDEEDPFGIFDEAMGDDDDDDGRRRKHRKSHDDDWDRGYGASKVLRSAKNPKRMYHRHGVIMARNKNAIKKDRKIIKEFLKDFIPGSAQWKKDLRNDLVDRWMRMYAVTSKQLKKLERQHRKAMAEKYRPKIDTARVLDFARGMVTNTADNWSNPNK